MNERLRRYRLLLGIGGIMFPLWGPLMAAALPAADQFYAGRFAVTFVTAAAILATYVSEFSRRHLESLFFFVVLFATGILLWMVQANNLDASFILAFQLLAFAVTICFETYRYMLLYLGLVTACVFFVGGDAPQVPKAIFTASTATFGLIALVNFYDRMKLVANLRRANDMHVKVAAEDRILRQTLMEREAYARALIDAIPGAVSWVDRDLKYVGVNQTQALGVNLTPEQFVGRDVGSVQAGTGEVAQMYRDTFASKEQVLTREVTLNVGPKPVTLFLSCSKYDEGKMAVLVAIDITSHKKDEETIRVQQAQLVQSSKLSMLGEMSGGVAHEINNPLAVIVGYAQRMEFLAKSGGIESTEVLRFADRILSMANRIAKIVQGLRMFAREASNDPFEHVSTHKIVQDTLELCAQRFSHHGLDLRIGASLESVSLDCRQVQISQVLLNLLNNAFDAVRHLPERWISVDASQRGDTVEIRVEDSGSGIEPAIASKMLQPFFTTKPIGQGTGLGLSISKGIIEAHGGRLYYDAVARNTSFVIELPRRQPAHGSRSAA